MTDYAGTINIDRIAWCCEQTHISRSALAQVAKTTPKRMEEGRLSYEQLVRIANYFGYSPYFFMRKEPPPKGTAHSVMFKTVASQQEISLNPSLLRVINLAQCHQEDYVDLMEEWKAPITFQPPALSGTLADKARQTREWLGLREGVAYGFDDYRRFVEQRGILVVRSQAYRGIWQLDHAKVVGFCMPGDEAPLIFVKKTTPQMQVFTLFHELGHLLLHGKRGHIDSENALLSGDSKKNELAANEFARSCLAPDPVFGRHENLTQQHAEAKPLPQRRAPKARRYREPLEIFGEGYVRTIMEAMGDGEITLSKACDWLGGVQVPDVLALREHMRGG